NGSSNIEVRSNILWAHAGYDVFVANDSQTGSWSDYNDLHASGTGRVAYWTKDFTDILDLQADVALIDLHSIGRTVVNPLWSEPRFVNRALDDYGVFGLVAGLRFSSPTVDAADPLTDQGFLAAGMAGLEPNLLANADFESGVTGWTVNVGGATKGGNPAAFEGSSYFFAGPVGVGFAMQTIDLLAAGFTAAQLDSQDLVVVFGGRMRSLNETT